MSDHSYEVQGAKPCAFCSGPALLSVIGQGPIGQRVINQSTLAAIQCGRCGVMMPALNWHDAQSKWDAPRPAEFSIP